jgi:hypothetical protein
MLRGNILFFGFCFTVLSFSLYSATVRLQNESLYSLTAKIYGADGSLIGEALIPKQETVVWSDVEGMREAKKKAPSRSKTPFRVHWYCMGGELFCLSEQVMNGSFVSTSQGIGGKTCSQETKEPSSP